MHCYSPVIIEFPQKNCTLKKDMVALFRPNRYQSARKYLQYYYVVVQGDYQWVTEWREEILSFLPLRGKSFLTALCANYAVNLINFSECIGASTASMINHVAFNLQPCTLHIHKKKKRNIEKSKLIVLHETVHFCFISGGVFLLFSYSQWYPI